MKLAFTLCLVIISSITYSQTNNDSVAIVKLLDKAAVAFRSGDAKTYADCWHIQPYSVVLVSTTDGNAMSIPAQAMIQPSPHMGQGGFATATNYKMSMHNDNAWTSFDEVSTSKDGVKSYSHEIWMVEKINGDWKFVGASIHQYKQQ